MPVLLFGRLRRAEPENGGGTRREPADPAGVSEIFLYFIEFSLDKRRFHDMMKAVPKKGDEGVDQ